MFQGYFGGAIVKKSVIQPLKRVNYNTVKFESSKSGCNQNHFKMAIILLHRNTDNVNELLAKLEKDKTKIGPAFAKATLGLGKMDVDSDIFPINVDEKDVVLDYYANQPEWIDKEVDPVKVSKIFYETHKDDYDFLVFAKSFETVMKASQYFPIKAIVEGIGLPTFNWAAFYGSQGKLLGEVILQTHFEGYLFVDTLFHEIGHLHCCFAGDPFSRGKNNAKLEIRDTNAHLVYPGSPYPSYSLMGAMHWEPNNDGTYRIENKPNSSPPPMYHPFELYFMGLLPKEEYGKKYPVYDRGINGVEEDKSQNATLYKQVSVNDIIAVMGERKCIELQPLYFPFNGWFRRFELKGFS